MQSDDSPRLKAGGFSSRSVTAPSEPKDVQCRIVIAVKFCSALTGVPTLFERLFLDRATSATDLAGGLGVDEQHLSPSICSFGDTILLELTPSSIHDTLV